MYMAGAIVALIFLNTVQALSAAPKIEHRTNPRLHLFKRVIEPAAMLKDLRARRIPEGKGCFKVGFAQAARSTRP